MNSLQQDFLQRTIAGLENLSRSAESENLSPEFIREISRTLHTIKGTSQTFGFANSANLAHELESLLSAAKNNADLKPVLLEGFALLTNSFEQIENKTGHRSFADKIHQISGDSTQSEDLFHAQIPSEISDRLSDYEKSAFASALTEGKEIFCLNANFGANNFSDEFKKLRESLSSNGEIIATLPNGQIEDKNKIGFVIYFAADASKNLSEITRKFSAEIGWQTVSFADSLEAVLSQIETHAKDLALKSSKEINIEISADKIAVSDARSNLIFDILLHLVRNSVDHGIETPEERIAKNKDSFGTIEIVLTAVENGLKLLVKDDGKGIDLAKLGAKAKEKNLVSADNSLTEAELLDLIFLHDFSTAETVNEISGRGVGLDVVRNLAENAGGKISVKSQRDVGTVFDIFLPMKV